LDRLDSKYGFFFGICPLGAWGRLFRELANFSSRLRASFRELQETRMIRLTTASATQSRRYSKAPALASICHLAASNATEFINWVQG